MCFPACETEWVGHRCGSGIRASGCSGHAGCHSRDGPAESQRKRNRSTGYASTQVFVGFGPMITDAALAAVQRDGTCWMGGTTWRGRRYMRIAVSNAATTDADVDRSVAAVLGAVDLVRCVR